MKKYFWFLNISIECILRLFQNLQWKTVNGIDSINATGRAWGDDRVWWWGGSDAGGIMLLMRAETAATPQSEWEREKLVQRLRGANYQRPDQGNTAAADNTWGNAPKSPLSWSAALQHGWMPPNSGGWLSCAESGRPCRGICAAGGGT